MCSLHKNFIATLLLFSSYAVATATSNKASPTLGNNFTLAALNNTLPNANLTGVPLVLGSAGAIDGESFYVSSTYYSYPYNDYPALGLLNGNLRAFDRRGNWHTNASAPFLGYEALSWATSTFYSGPASTAFSAFTFPASIYPVLGVNGEYDMWYLCPSDERLGQNSVYYNTTSMAFSNEPSSRVSCYSVTLNMVPL
ncbi:hypothetical protein J3R30DRAFT_3280448 [Lentinula aciculospora]|uniref:Uncharacterized protein n=1 Tax=Lentinula aciculospora TaxID=153920 RepID=A0A9W9DW18_9AGAR|nr:hypothetical protein J3R30DRAFT_3290563 [Lentinula aciculospora]KAJ4487598.1 hypothetical protein J3R30DRAFT_3280448 [Lentinula aciculospora]